MRCSAHSYLCSRHVFQSNGACRVDVERAPVVKRKVELAAQGLSCAGECGVEQLLLVGPAQHIDHVISQGLGRSGEARAVRVRSTSRGDRGKRLESVGEIWSSASVSLGDKRLHEKIARASYINVSPHVVGTRDSRS